MAPRCRFVALSGADKEKTAVIGHWEREREQIASTVVVPSPEFEFGRSTGRSLSLDEAVEYALGED